MKHNTHIYLAGKAIALMVQSVANMRTAGGAYLRGTKKTRETNEAKRRKRIMEYYQDLIEEASWVPDDVLHDNDPNHIFKLFTDREFPGHGLTAKQTFDKGGIVYYKFAGALPYRVDHLARSIADMEKLRDHNDQYELRQIMYKYMLLSHYIADAHVPMHCDLRDDPPTGRSTNPSRRSGTRKPRGKYLKSSAHAELEILWDDAVTPVAISEQIISRSTVKERLEPTDYSAAITFTLNDARKGGVVKPTVIKKNGLMEFMIDVCIQSKKRGQQLFPIATPQVRQDHILENLTREIFADCIGNLISVWRYIWFFYRN